MAATIWRENHAGGRGASRRGRHRRNNNQVAPRSSHPLRPSRFYRGAQSGSRSTGKVGRSLSYSRDRHIFRVSLVTHPPHPSFLPLARDALTCSRRVNRVKLVHYVYLVRARPPVSKTRYVHVRARWIRKLLDEERPRSPALLRRRASVKLTRSALVEGVNYLSSSDRPDAAEPGIGISPGIDRYVKRWIEAHSESNLTYRWETYARRYPAASDRIGIERSYVTAFPAVGRKTSGRFNSEYWKIQALFGEIIILRKR